jgi:glycosyltransferase involved in cell wall biosynthesis
MRILALNWRDVLNPLAGGAEELVHQEGVELSKLGHEFTLFTSAFEGAPTLDHVGDHKVIRRGSRLTVYAEAYRFLKDRRNSVNFDVVLEHVNGVPWYCPLWCSIPSAAYLYHVVGKIFFQELPAPLAAVGYLCERTLPLAYSSTLSGCLGRAAKHEFAKLGLPERTLRVIPPGVDHGRFRPGANKSPHPTFISLGPIKRYKRHDLILRAFAVLLKREPTSRLIILGRDRNGTVASLKSLISQLGLEEAVQFPGYLEETGKVALMQQAWALIYASEAEGWGLGVTEAAACGTPSIVPRAGGMTDAVPSEARWLSYHPGSHEELATKLLELIRSDVARIEMNRFVLKDSLRYSWEAHGRAVAEMLSAATVSGGHHS